MRPYDYVLLPLHEILSTLNYEKKLEKSSTRHITMNHSNGDVLVITRKPNGHYLYFNPFNERDKGNIHHFCKLRSIDVKKLIAGKHIDLNHHAIEPTELQDKEIKASIKFKDFRSINLSSKNPAYRGLYLRNRGIKEEIFSHLTIKIDTYKNICFPTYTYEKKLNAKDLVQCGYSAKLNQPLPKDKEGKNYKKPLSTLAFGKKGIEILKDKRTKSLKDIKYIIITESSIDSMSLLQILELDTKISLLCATSGTFSKSAKEALLFLLQNCSNSIYIFLGFDNDKQGKVFTKQLEELLQPFSFTYEIKIPQHKDFNEDLQTSKCDS